MPDMNLLSAYRRLAEIPLIGALSAEPSALGQFESLCNGAVHIFVLAFFVSLVRKIATAECSRHLITTQFMRKGIDGKGVERETGIEPATFSLGI
jgi:hypothetical protein